jgi:hypothetical protein
MEIVFIIALVVAIPIIMLPAIFIWYINVGGLLQVWKDIRARNRRRALRSEAQEC